MTALPPEDIDTIIARVLASAPDWLRSDLASSDSRSRERAEEALAAMLSAALQGTQG